MKCDKCKYLYRPTYENETESYCTLFCDDSDDLTDDGCRFNSRTLDAKARKQREEINSIEGYKFKKPDFKFLLFDQLGQSGYCTANNLRQAIWTAGRMLMDMRCVVVFEIVKTDIGYRTVEAMSIHKIDKVACIHEGDPAIGLHVNWYLMNYKKLDY